ncbi:hypothetical protein PG985_002035 [Apiospora marii]|uniref:uncharacterized protein n=1 Tax=Apiospora marii TaxID=335849 RepID=UPI00312D3B03
MPYIWSEIDVCVVLLFSCGLSVREILHTSKITTAPRRQPPSSASLAPLGWPSYLAHHLRQLGRAEGGRRRPRNTAAAGASDTFQERIAWLELLNAHTGYGVPGSRRPLGTQIMIEACPSAAKEATPTPAPAVAQTNWCKHARIDEVVEECGKGKKSMGGGGIMVTREVVCTVEETVESGKHGEEGEAYDQDMSSSSGPGSVVLMTTSTRDDGT